MWGVRDAIPSQCLQCMEYMVWQHNNGNDSVTGFYSPQRHNVSRLTPEQCFTVCDDIHIMNDCGPVSWTLWRIFVSGLATLHAFGVNRATAYLGCHHYNLSEMVAVQCFGYIAAQYLEVYFLLLSWGQWRISAPSQQRVVVLTLVTL